MMRSRLFRILVILAGIMGADGVILAAASAHQPDAARLASASSMLLFHATAVLAVVALAERGVIHARIGIAAASGFVVAAALFACQQPATQAQAQQQALDWHDPEPLLEQ